MNLPRLLDITRSILAQPTAPFHEDAVRAEIHLQLAQCPHVTLHQDAFGNVIARYQRGHHPGHFAFAAHMDHPAYVGTEFLGGVPEEYRRNGKTRDFGAFSMWDLPAFELQGDRIVSRACDDLIGCAAIVAMMHELEENAVECTCYGLFTRAEEVGFIGAIHLAKSGDLPRDITVISLETSSERGGPARMGEGVIVRVGDRTGIFCPRATAALGRLAAQHEIPVQRLLMSGGTCEATAYQVYGYRAAGLCVALGNYHNCGPDQQIAAEYVSQADVLALVRLCTATAASADFTDPDAELRERYERNLEAYRRFFPEMTPRAST